MLILDAHCDTLTRMMDLGEDLYQNQLHFDILRTQKHPAHIQFLAAFIDPAWVQTNPLHRAIDILDTLYRSLGQYSKYMKLCLKDTDIEDAIAHHKLGVVLSIENGAAIEGKLSVLRALYRLGVRSICLTWNHNNEISGGIMEATLEEGLTDFGHAVVKEMNALGMLIDVSHISMKGFWDVIEITQKPIIASHSNARKLCPHPRNLEDAQLLAIQKNGGVVGINFYPGFLNNSGKASIADIVAHIEYIASLIGTDHIGIGSDFDGIETTPIGMEGVQDLTLLWDALLKLNYSSTFVKKLAGENFLRVLKNTLKK